MNKSPFRESPTQLRDDNSFIALADALDFHAALMEHEISLASGIEDDLHARVERSAELTLVLIEQFGGGLAGRLHKEKTIFL